MDSPYENPALPTTPGLSWRSLQRIDVGSISALATACLALAKDPVRMARAMSLACEAGRLAFLAGRIPKRRYAQASSPVDGVIE